jgi:isoleucyl-tRNA synthetase
VFLTDFPATLGKYRDPELAAAFDRLMGVRDLVKKSLEEQRVKKVIGHPLEAAVTIKAGTDHAAAGPLARHLAALRELFIVSSVAVVTEEGEGLAVSSAHASGEKCVRCWNWSESTGKNAEFPGVCGRCAGVLAHLKGG